MEQATKRLTACYIQRRSYLSACAWEISHTYTSDTAELLASCEYAKAHCARFSGEMIFFWFDGNVFVCASYNVIIMFSPFRVTHVPFVARRTTCLAIEIVAHTITQQYDTHGNQMINLSLFYYMFLFQWKLLEHWKSWKMLLMRSFILMEVENNSDISRGIQLDDCCSFDSPSTKLYFLRNMWTELLVYNTRCSRYIFNGYRIQTYVPSARRRNFPQCSYIWINSTWYIVWLCS